MSVEEQMPNWINEEVRELEQTQPQRELLPALKIEENKLVTIEVDWSKPFEKYIDEINHQTKKILPVTVNGQKMVWFLNVKNPTFREIIQAGAKGQKTFDITRTGQGKATKYNIIRK